MEKLFIAGLLAFFLCINTSSFAQDNHYWAQQFGGKAALLGGAVVGGFEDNSAMYYNPGAFAFVDQVNLSINTDVYKFEDMVIRDGVGKDLNIFSRRVSLIPQMMSGLLTHKPESPINIGFIMLTRHQDNIDFNQRNAMYYDVMPDNPGDEYYIGNLDIQDMMTETWAGLSVGWQVSKNFGIGLSSFFSYRNQRYIYNLSAFASITDSLNNYSNAFFRYSDAVRVNTIRAFIKGGLHWRFGKWRLGVAAISPSISIWAESRAFRELSYFGIPGQADITYSDQQKKIPTVYKHPYAISLGFNRLFKKGSIGFSTEYYGKIPLYQMVKAEIRNVAYPVPPTGEAIDFLGFQNYSNAVLNFALGGEIQITKRWVLAGSLRTDFTSQRWLPHEVRSTVLEKPLLNVPVMDLYHLASGLSYKRSNSLMTFGATFSYGIIDKTNQIVNFTDPQLSNTLLGNREKISKVTDWSLALLIGYTYFFALK